jgi:hypothetical protein
MSPQKIRLSFAVVPLLLAGAGLLGCARADEHLYQWQGVEDQRWVGPDFWANRLQDWQIRDGRLECLNGNIKKPMRTVHLLTGQLDPKAGEGFRVEVVLGAVTPEEKIDEQAAAGILVGAGAGLDYRAASLIHHSPGPGGGLFIGMDGRSRLFVRDFADDNQLVEVSETSLTWKKPLQLSITGEPTASGKILISLGSVSDSSQSYGITLDSSWRQRLPGNLALVSHPGAEDGSRFNFKTLRVVGGLSNHPERHCGPIISTQYTVSRGILKLTAQLMPIAVEPDSSVFLQVNRDQLWQTLGESSIAVPSWTATFRLDEWDDSHDIPFRVIYRREEQYAWQGVIRKNPSGQESIAVAAFTGNHNVTRPLLPRSWAGVDGGYFPWNNGLFFPHNDLTSHVSAHKPDLLFFSGDQVYEGSSPTGADFSAASLDYLYKWYLWCWAFRDLTAQIPTVTIPDDHDVFHGNIWGCSGKAVTAGTRGAVAQDSGGYKLSPEFVRMVETTQTSHLPDPYNPTPVKQGIGVYYTDLVWGGVSFAIIEDRKFKSAPAPLLPEAAVKNGWVTSKSFDAKTSSDAPGAVLLGERQLAFLSSWAADWSGGVWMKALLSQTIFANVATLPSQAQSGSVIPELPILAPGEYPPNDRPVADMDSNGWPRSGRDRAVRAMRKGYAVHIAGDQHLGSTIQYGLDGWRDASYAICVPSVANFWPRRWFPQSPGRNRRQDDARYTGDFEDGFGNRMTVHAISNPVRTGKEPSFLHDLSPGYGVVRFYKSRREIVMENWPRSDDPATGKPYPGWPVQFRQIDNYGQHPQAWLPELEVTGLVNPVVQVVDEESGEIVNTIRVHPNLFRPRAPHPGRFTVRVGDPDEGVWQELTGLETRRQPDDKPIKVAIKEENGR